jgi:hypothetical protein
MESSSSTIFFFEILKQSAFEEAEKPETGLKQRTVTVWKWIEGSDSQKLASRCWRTMMQMSYEQASDKELRGCLLAVREF